MKNLDLFIKMKILLVFIFLVILMPLYLIFPNSVLITLVFIYMSSAYFHPTDDKKMTIILHISYLLLLLPLIIVIWYVKVNLFISMYSYFLLSFIIIFLIYFKNKDKIENIFMLFAIILNLSYVIIINFFDIQNYNMILVLFLVLPSNFILFFYIYKEMIKGKLLRYKISVKMAYIYLQIAMLFIFLLLVLSYRLKLGELNIIATVTLAYYIYFIDYIKIDKEI